VGLNLFSAGVWTRNPQKLLPALHQQEPPATDLETLSDLSNRGHGHLIRKMKPEGRCREKKNARSEKRISSGQEEAIRKTVQSSSNMKDELLTSHLTTSELPLPLSPGNF